MSCEPLLTIAIPAFNPDHRLLDALKQLHDQTQGISIEVIVVQSGNTLPAGTIQACLINPTVIVTSSRKLGPSEARNIALAKARGQWIHFHDADDIPGQDYQLICRDFLMDSTHDVDVVCFGYENILNAKSVTVRYTDAGLEGRAIKLGSDWILAYLRRYAMTPYRYTLFTHVWNKFFRLEFLRCKGIQFHERLDQLEDVNFNLKCLASKCRVSVFPNQIIYQYRVNSGVSNQSKLSGERGARDIRDTVRALMPMQNVLRDAYPVDERKSIVRSLYANTLVTWVIRIGRRPHSLRRLTDIFEEYVKSSIVQVSLKSYIRPTDADAFAPLLLRIRNPILIAAYFYLKRRA